MLRQISKWSLICTSLVVSLWLLGEKMAPNNTVATVQTPGEAKSAADETLEQGTLKPASEATEVERLVQPDIKTEPFLRADWRQANRWQQLRDFHYFLKTAGLQVVQFVVATEKKQLGAEVQLVKTDEQQVLKAIQQMTKRHALTIQVDRQSKRASALTRVSYQLRFTEKNQDSFEILLQEEPTELMQKRNSLTVKNQAPVLVIIVDDLGYNKQRAAEFLELQADLTFSILPFLPFSSQIVEMAYEKNRQILLHMPMESLNKNLKLSQHGLSLEDDQQSIQTKMNAALLNIPYALGFNNHMGSAFTDSLYPMEWLVKISKQKNLLFVNSKTTATNIPSDVTKKHGAAYVGRDVFLDADKSLPQIKKQLALAVKIANLHGEAVAIAHPYKQTLQVLKSELPKIKQQIQITGIYNLPSLHKWKQYWGVL